MEDYTPQDDTSGIVRGRIPAETGNHSYLSRVVRRPANPADHTLMERPVGSPSNTGLLPKLFPQASTERSQQMKERSFAAQHSVNRQTSQKSNAGRSAHPQSDLMEGLGDLGDFPKDKRGVGKIASWTGNVWRKLQGIVSANDYDNPVYPQVPGSVRRGGRNLDSFARKNPAGYLRGHRISEPGDSSENGYGADRSSDPTFARGSVRAAIYSVQGKPGANASFLRDDAANADIMILNTDSRPADDEYDETLTQEQYQDRSSCPAVIGRVNNAVNHIANASPRRISATDDTYTTSKSPALSAFATPAAVPASVANNVNLINGTTDMGEGTESYQSETQGLLTNKTSKQRMPDSLPLLYEAMSAPGALTADPPRLLRRGGPKSLLNPTGGSVKLVGERGGPGGLRAKSMLAGMSAPGLMPASSQSGNASTSGSKMSHANRRLSMVGTVQA